MYIENKEKIPELTKGDKVYITEGIRNQHGIFTKGHEFTYVGDDGVGRMWFTDEGNRSFTLDILHPREVNDTFTIKKVENGK